MEKRSWKNCNTSGSHWRNRRIVLAESKATLLDINKAGKKYSEVWLTDVDFGGLYQSGQYVLNVKADHQIDNCKDEIVEILNILDSRAHDELQLIWSVNVYNADDQIHCAEERELIYNEENECK